MLFFPAASLLRQSVSVIAFAMCLITSGCAPLPPTTQDLPLRQSRSRITSFTLDGRIAVHQGDRHYSGNISWQHAAEHDEMLLTTPLGQGIAELIRNPADARLTLADRREFAAADWEELATRVLGISLPLTALPRWLVAEIPATAQDVALDETGRLQHLRIDGWRVSYLDYENENANALPILIELQRDDIDVRLKIDEWSQVR